MSYFRNGFLNLSVLSLTLLVLGCSEQKDEVVVEPQKTSEAASETVTHDDSKYDEEFKKVGEVYLAGAMAQDKDKMREAVKLISDLIEKEPNDTKFLGQRINIYMSLDEPEKALADLKKRNSLQKSGTFKFGECMIKDSISRSLDSPACYKEAADIFSKELPEPEKDANYLVALLYSGDTSAPQKIQTLMGSTDKEWEKEGLQMYLDSYEKYVECKKSTDTPCPIS